jgi:thiamine-phosphate pyrophosphorylase
MPRLLIITDDTAPLRHGRSVLGTLARAFDDVVIDGPGGPGVAVVVRARHLPIDDTARLCVSVRQVLTPAGVSVLVHGHPALVAPLGLHGVHLPAAMAEAGLGPIRALLPPGALLGVSAHPRQPGDVCAIDGADYATWSPIFPPSSKHDQRPPLGLSALAGHQTPVVALGGVDQSTAAACIGAGAAGVAVLGAVLGAANPAHALRGLLDALEIPWRRRRGAKRQPQPFLDAA